MFKAGDKVEVICNNPLNKDFIMIGLQGLVVKTDDEWQKVDFVIGEEWFEDYELKLVDDEVCEELDKTPVDPSEFISLDYRTEYHNKVAECEKLKQQVEYLWEQVLGE